MVGKWRQRFIDRDLAGLLDEPRPAAPKGCKALLAPTCETLTVTCGSPVGLSGGGSTAATISGSVSYTAETDRLRSKAGSAYRR
jgi:hypothetical protein